MYQPESDWKLPSSFPSLKQANIIGIDLETRDPNLRTLGPGGVRGDGEVIGVAVSTDDGFYGYYPFGHISGDQFSRENVLRWLSNELKHNKQIKVAHNAVYDLEWLKCSGVQIAGPVHCTQCIEALIDEESDTGYSLDALLAKYFGLGKDEALLDEAAAAYGVKDKKSDMYMIPSQYVGPYAEQDVRHLPTLYKKQKEEIEKQDLTKIFDLEMRLLPVLLNMRMKGVRIDEEKAEILSKQFDARSTACLAELKNLSGLDINVWSGPQVARGCDKLKIEYPRTSRGAPSFVDAWLKFQKHPFLKEVKKARAVSKLKGMFVDDLIKKFLVNGRIHTQFHQLKNDENGARTGRLASSNPNLQQVPKRDPELAPLIRGLFIPEPGCKWLKSDYAQQEPRLVVHYALLLKLYGAEKFAEGYLNDRGMDFYKPIIEITKVNRRDSKDLALGRFYGMGKQKMAKRLDTDIDTAIEMLRKFDAAAPFVKELSDRCAARAQSRGFIRTIGGRIRHFNLWEPTDAMQKMRNGVECPGLPWKKAQEAYTTTGLRRAGTHKALNSLIQGGAADMMKIALVNMYEQDGITPHLTVHDEVGDSMYDNEYRNKVLAHMEGAVKLKIPVVCDCDVGDNWAVEEA